MERLTPEEYQRLEFELPAQRKQEVIFTDKSPEISIELTDGETVTLNWYNTTVYEFSRYPMFNHVFLVKEREDGQAGGVYFWNNQDLANRLKENNFKTVTEAMPSANDYRYWLSMQVGDIDEPLTPTDD